MRKLAETFSMVFFALFCSFASVVAIPNNTYAAEVFNVTEASVESASAGATATIAGIEGNEVTSDVRFTSVGDTITYSIKIKNNNDKNVRIISVTDNNESEYISYEYNAAPDYELAVGDEYVFTPKLTYISSIRDWEDHELSIAVKFTFAYEEVEDTRNSGNIETADIMIGSVPNTGDSIMVPVIILGVSALGLIAVIILTKKVKGKAKLLSVLAVVIAASSVITCAIFAATKKTFDVDLVVRFTFDNVYPITYEGVTPIERALTRNPGCYIPGEREITLNNPSRANYNFTGWTGSNGDAEDTGVVIPITATGPLHYVANWTPIEYAITLHLEGGTLNPMPPATYTVDSPDIYIGEPTRPGYEFMGWSGTNIPNVTMAYRVLTGSTGDLEFTAIWSPIRYNIYYSGIDNTGVDTYITGSIEPHLDISYEDEVVLRENAFILNHPDANYRFAGYILRDVHENRIIGEYQPGDVVSGLCTQRDGVVEVTPKWEYLSPKLKVGDVVNYRPNASDANGTAFGTPYSYVAAGDKSGTGSDQTFSSNNGMQKWRVLEIANDGTVTLIGSTSANLNLKGFAGFKNSSELLDGAASVYGHGFGAVSARSLDMGDFYRNITDNMIPTAVTYGQVRNTNYGFNRTLLNEVSRGRDENGFMQVEYGDTVSVAGGTSFAMTNYSITYGGKRSAVVNEKVYNVLFDGLWGSSYGAWINQRSVDSVNQDAKYMIQTIKANNIGSSVLRSTGMSAKDSSVGARIAPVVTMRSDAIYTWDDVWLKWDISQE